MFFHTVAAVFSFFPIVYTPLWRMFVAGLLFSLNAGWEYGPIVCLHCSMVIPMIPEVKKMEWKKYDLIQLVSGLF